MARAREVPGLAAGDSFAAAAAKVVATRAAELFEHEAHVLDVGDIERVHDMRVATRRLRAVLEIFAPCFPRGAHREVLRDVKALADALGERRDPDVHIDALERFADAAPPSARPGVTTLVDRFRAEQAAANEHLGAALAAAERSQLRVRLAALTDAAAP